MSRRGSLVISFCLALSGAGAAALDLDAPISSLIPELQRAPRAAEFAREFRGLNLEAYHSIARLITPDFYRGYVSIKNRYALGHSPFHRVRRGQAWETIIGRALAEHGLAFDMTPAEVDAYRAGRSGALFRRLDGVVAKGDSGRKLSWRWMNTLGLYLIKDFRRAYAEELELAPEKQFVRAYKSTAAMVLPYKLAIDEALAAESPPPGEGGEDAAAARAWITRARAACSDRPEFVAACDLLLRELSGDADAH